MSDYTTYSWGFGDERWQSLLVGREIIWLEVERNDQSALRFRCADGTVVTWVAQGDCCSDTWFADITNLRALGPFALSTDNPVVSVVDIDLPGRDDDGRCRQDVDAYYGVDITTRAGVVSIVYRNSSNGYYGGWFEEFEGDGSDKPEYNNDGWLEEFSGEGEGNREYDDIALNTDEWQSPA